MKHSKELNKAALLMIWKKRAIARNVLSADDTWSQLVLSQSKQMKYGSPKILISSPDGVYPELVDAHQSKWIAAKHYRFLAAKDSRPSGLY